MRKKILLTSVLTQFLFIAVFAQNSTIRSSAKNDIDNKISEWVYPGTNGRLVYKATAKGDKIIDFSHAGYMGGGVALPEVPVKITIQPTGSDDDTKLIQSAVDKVAAMPAVNGFRGAVLLAPGSFTCQGTIRITTSGVVLRGSGSGKNGTTIHMTGSKHSAFIIGGRDNTSSDENDESISNQPLSSGATMITDEYVPSGASSFTVADASLFKVGDGIEIKRPATNAWIELMQMHNLVRDGKPQTWIGKNRVEITNRKIVGITGNKISVDIPLADSYDAKYLNPPGTMITKLGPPNRITQSGIEKLHVQCPPLEIAYGDAPYSGVRINADDCWVKDIYFEETMNTSVIAGDRITMQNVIVKHTYPNLGASKPGDFGIEGSQILLDRCESSGDNQYFVWTTSLKPGPNVVLNSTFHGHGSRIQPHMRWSTALLIDNCSVPEGGIDFMNRGVAGSGHGWTMGWAVAWNCIAKTYIIQNPPGSMNWAIGCKGDRVKTARLFDTAPILAEGIFDSHDTPVQPQSLYLAQLQERKGLQALKNIGYTSNTIQMFENKNAKPLPPLEIQTDKILGADLAMHRPVNTSNTRGDTREFGGEKALDGNEKTYWATNDGATQSRIEIDMEGPVEINAIEIDEANGLQGRVQQYKVEGQVDSDWKLLSQGTTIDNRKIDRFPATTVWKVRITIIKVQDYPAISKIGLYRENKTSSKAF